MTGKEYREKRARLHPQFDCDLIARLDVEYIEGIEGSEISIYYPQDETSAIQTIIGELNCEICKERLAAKIETPKERIRRDDDRYPETKMIIATNKAKIALLLYYNGHLVREHTD